MGEMLRKTRQIIQEEVEKADVFVQSEETAAERAGNTGYLTYYVLKEGVEV